MEPVRKAKGKNALPEAPKGRIHTTAESTHLLAARSPKKEDTMKVITYDQFKPGVTMEQVRPMLPEETAHAWRLWKQGIIRENYAIADRPGVVIVFEVEDVAEAKRHLDDFPMTKADCWNGS